MGWDKSNIGAHTVGNRQVEIKPESLLSNLIKSMIIDCLLRFSSYLVHSTISHTLLLIFPIISHPSYQHGLLVTIYDTHAYSFTFVPHFSIT